MKSLPPGTEIDWSQTIAAADIEALRELPFCVKEYLRTMIDPPLAAIALESVMLCGVKATMDALRERELLGRLKGTVH